MSDGKKDISELFKQLSGEFTDEGVKTVSGDSLFSDTDNSSKNDTINDMDSVIKKKAELDGLLKNLKKEINFSEEVKEETNDEIIEENKEDIKEGSNDEAITSVIKKKAELDGLLKNLKKEINFSEEVKEEEKDEVSEENKENKEEVKEETNDEAEPEKTEVAKDEVIVTEEKEEKPKRTYKKKAKYDNKSAAEKVRSFARAIMEGDNISEEELRSFEPKDEEIVDGTETENADNFSGEEPHPIEKLQNYVETVNAEKEESADPKRVNKLKAYLESLFKVKYEDETGDMQEANEDISEIKEPVNTPSFEPKTVIVSQPVVEETNKEDDEQEIKEKATKKEIEDDKKKIEQLKADMDGKLFQALWNAVCSGNNKLQQTISRETMVIDDNWVSMIENYLFSIEQIVKKPRTFIKETREVVSIEKARRIDGLAIRHLASHTANIRSIDDKGNVEPSKILAKFLDEDICIYENRFVYTLLLRLKKFINDRYSGIRDYVNTKDTTNLYFGSDFNFGKAKINYDLNVKVIVPSSKVAMIEQNFNILERLEAIDKKISIMLNTEFSREMKKQKLISPPIMKTNLLKGHVYYSNAYKLWIYISSYETLGYTENIEDKTLPFDDDYFDDLTKVVASSLKNMLHNNTIRKSIYRSVDFERKRVKKYKVVRKIELASNQKLGEKIPMDVAVNQYYFDKMKELTKDIAEKSTAADVAIDTVTINSNFRRYFKGLNKINNALYTDVMKASTPKESKNKNMLERKRTELRANRELLKKMELLTALKQEEVELSKKRDITQLNKCRKIEDELRLRELKEEKRKKDLEKKREKELLKKQREKERLNKERAKEREAQRLLKEKEKAERAAEQERIAENNDNGGLDGNFKTH